MLQCLLHLLWFDPIMNTSSISCLPVTPCSSYPCCAPLPHPPPPPPPVPSFPAQSFIKAGHGNHAASLMICSRHDALVLASPASSPSSPPPPLQSSPPPPSLPPCPITQPFIGAWSPAERMMSWSSCSSLMACCKACWTAQGRAPQQTFPTSLPSLR